MTQGNMLSPTVKLNSGHDMPLVGFGCWKVNNDTCADQIYNAIKAGYRLFDGACDYGNERECGDGIARAIKDGIVTRSDLFIVSKLWCTYHEKERVAQACKKSLQDWRLDYFDLYLVHFPVALKYVDFAVKYPPELEDEFGAVLPFGSATNQETWTAMEALVDVGLARSIGVSNYNSQSIMDLLRYARIQPATLQIEHHPYLAQERLVKYATEQGIQITAYSSFGPASFMELQFKMAQKCGPLLEDGGVKTIAQRHGKTSAQVLLRWATQRGVAVIPKSNHLTRLKENLDCCTFDLEEGDMEYLNGLDRGLRFNDFVHYGYNVPVFA